MCSKNRVQGPSGEQLDVVKEQQDSQFGQSGKKGGESDKRWKLENILGEYQTGLCGEGLHFTL